MKREVKQQWSAIPLISTKRIITSHLIPLNTKIGTACDVCVLIYAGNVCW